MDIILGYFFLVVLLQHRSLGQSCLRRKYGKAGPFLTPRLCSAHSRYIGNNSS